MSNATPEMDQREPVPGASRAEGAKARPLHGMKAICAYLEKSESTVLKLIRAEDLPAAKIGGEWVSDEGRIDDWRLRRIG